MGRQPRAEATRRKIIDAAVDLFRDPGFGDTGLAEILAQAEVTKGAFYYHFDSKESVASAIIDEAFQKIVAASDAVIDSSSPSLEDIIAATFAVARVTTTDETARVGKQLAQSLSQVSDHGPKAYLDWTALFVGQVAAAVGRGELCQGIDPHEVGETVWVAMLGCHLLSDAIGDDIHDRLARAWRVLLTGIVPQRSLPYFLDFVTRTHQTYANSRCPAQ